MIRMLELIMFIQWGNISCCYTLCLCLQFLVPKYYTEFIDDLTTLVNNKFIPMSRIDDAVRRILRVKFMMGIFENPFVDYSLVKYLGIKVSYFPFTSLSSQLDITYKDHPINVSSMLIWILNRCIENWPGKL